METTYSKVGLPSTMNNNEDKIINSDKPTKVGKSINTENKLTRQVDITNSGISTWPMDMTRSVKSRMEVDVNGDGQLTKEVNMMKIHIPRMYVDMIGEGIKTNKVEDNNLLEGDDLLLEMMMTLKLEIKLGQFIRICPQLMKMMEKSLMRMKTNQVIDVCNVNIVKVEDFDEAIPVV
jgi:hypothetical protein